jgi:hypothetical protein
LAGPGLPTNVAAGGTGHVSHTNTVHGLVNKLDTGIGSAATGDVLTWGGSVYAPAAPGTSGGIMALESAAGVAVGNSGATNRTNFNAWASANPGVPIFFRAGIYDFSGGTMSPKGSVYGAGPGVAVLRFPEQSVSNMYIISVDNITLADFEIRSTSTATPLAVGINDADSNHLTLDHCTIFDISNVYCNGAANMGIHIRDVHRGRVSGCRVFGTTRDGIHVTAGSTDVSVVGNQIHTPGDDAIALISYNADAAQNINISVVGNTITNVERARGITVEGCLNAAVVGNSIYGTDGYGILLNSIGSSPSDTWGSVNVLCADNVVTDAGNDGIHINGKTEDLVVRGNTIRNSGNGAIRVLNGRVTIDGNFIDQNATGSAITLSSGAIADFSVITNNVIRRAQANAIYCEAQDNIRFSGNTIHQPNVDGTARPGALFYNCQNVMATDNRVDGTATKLTYGVYLDTVTGALLQGNYATNATTATTGNTGSTGILTS